MQMPPLPSLWCYCPRSWSLDCLRSSGGRNPAATSSHVSLVCLWMQALNSFLHFKWGEMQEEEAMIFSRKKQVLGGGQHQTFPAVSILSHFAPSKAPWLKIWAAWGRKNSSDKGLWGKRADRGKVWHYLLLYCIFRAEIIYFHLGL